MAQSLKTKKYPGCLVLIFAFLLLYSAARAAENKDCSARAGGYCASLAQVSGGETKNVFSIERILGLDEKAEIGDVLAALYRFALGLVGLSALIMIVFGGITYMSAGDSQERVKQAKGAIQNAIFGLILALLSYLILRTINPDLVAKLNLNNLITVEKAIGNLEPLNRQSVSSGSCQRMTTIRDKPYCLTDEADRSQKLTGDGAQCLAKGGEIIQTGLGPYCSVPYK